ncbi:Asparaginase [Bombilactobacillus mellifer]|uniref:asparaginase n=1 Tax=Bombilactobacillus mellifer TaxID=1218492 RepID=A0A0F4LVG9_9LACO|nr:asparaginase [Bombilactobacillus mellifer]KJY62605.1 Asparaginase [Bombilactobacillus mellifer]
MTKKILILHTGGTISMSEDATGKIKPNAQNPLAELPLDSQGQIQLVTEEIFNLPSPHITPAHMLRLSQRLRQAAAEGFDGAVVTHGTDTLEETALFLDLTLTSTMPVVVTGAMRSSNEIGSDGLYNFRTAIMVASANASVGKGVVVVMNDEIHSARYVTKTHTTNVATFRTPTFGPIGIVSEGHVNYMQTINPQPHLPIEKVITEVYLIKAYAGMTGTLFQALNQPTTRGIVIEALGAGNLPPQTLAALQALVHQNIPLVLVSRCFNGIAEPVYDYQGGGVNLAQMGIIFCRGLNGPKARIKLLVGLSAGLQGSALKKYLNS